MAEEEALPVSGVVLAPGPEVGLGGLVGAGEPLLELLPALLKRPPFCPNVVKAETARLGELAHSGPSAAPAVETCTGLAP